MKTVLVPVVDLSFDHKNPRLSEYGIAPRTSQDEVIRVLWEAMDLLELMQSIAASGFFRHESLIVAKENNRQVVIEGNRRLAAVKIFLDPKIAESNKWKIPAISSAAQLELQQLPVTRLDRQEAWRILGFKHVNGPAKWSSYAKAKYIADVQINYKISLTDIAKQIGDNHGTVQTLYRGLMVLEQAERTNVFQREDRFRKNLSFSHLTTGLGYRGLSSFLSLKPTHEESTDPVPHEKLEQLGELCKWFYGSKKDNCPPLVESQNPHLRQLDAIVKNREAVAALRSGVEIGAAFEISRPSSAIFEEALLDAKRALQKARAQLTTGYDKSEGLLKIAGTIANLADDIYDEMDRKRNTRKNERISGSD